LGKGQTGSSGNNSGEETQYAYFAKKGKEGPVQDRVDASGKKPEDDEDGELTE